MKNALSFGIAGWLAFAVFGCAGSDGADLSAAGDATPTMDAGASPLTDGVSMPASLTSEDLSLPPLERDPVDANVDSAKPIFGDPLEPLKAAHDWASGGGAAQVSGAN